MRCRPIHLTIGTMIEQTMAADGVCLAKTLKHAGFDWHAIKRALDAKRLVRLRHGVYCTDPDDPRAQAGAHGGTMACASALRSYGVWVLEEAQTLHVGLGLHARAHAHASCACVAHRDQHSHGFGCAQVRVALVQIAKCLGDEAFFAALESALHKRLVSRADLLWIRTRLSSRFSVLVDIARSDAESGLESLTRLRLFRMGISVRTQVRIRGVGRVDLVIGNLIIELDGRENHDGPSHRHKDLVRDAAAVCLGWRVLRFDYAMVVHNWDLVREAILAALS